MFLAVNCCRNYRTSCRVNLIFGASNVHTIMYLEFFGVILF